MTKRIAKHYDIFSKLYDILSPKAYYLKARKKAVDELELKEGNTVLNVACGTGQSFEFFQEYLKGTGLIIGVDFSEGMLSKAKEKVSRNGWQNVRLVNGDANLLSEDWLRHKLNSDTKLQIDASICELGLSAIPNWENVLNRIIEVTGPKGKIVIMDWYMKKLTIRGHIVNLIGNADITRPTWQHLEKHSCNFKLENSFNRGNVFVASAKKKDQHPKKHKNNI